MDDAYSSAQARPAQTPSAPPQVSATGIDQAEGTPLIAPSTVDHPLYEQVVEACKTVYDPEIPVNIYDLGLIYTIQIDDENAVRIVMTLTAPGCPVAGEMPGWVADAVEPLPGVRQVDVEMTFQPQWGMDMMSDEARLELGFM
ncbi:SUF system Fe-S cluster assembly protein [uncultured Paracoccus sp.]|uniref:SUF system Fe-S cluster assembly protein n=1 Tax=uncultured Paracoccus sp. TaxID=189685 RepID=UPI0026235012|nr:SUF system Fe-S cluster assembly protein [uncultured Paracoccus sp.]